MELRRLREAAGLTIEEAADRLEFSSAKISRIETARVAVLTRDVRDMLDLYEVEGALREALLQLAREARQKGWWQASWGDLPIAAFVGLESAATSIREYSALLVPGQLQIREYARAVLQSIRLDLKPNQEEIERRVELRMARQSIFAQDPLPTFWAVLDEAALHRPVGGANLMREQLEHLMEIAAQRNVTLQVLPYIAGEHPGMDGAFTIMSFSERADPDVVYIEATTNDLYLEDAAAVSRYVLLFDHIRAAALSPSDSVKFFARVARDL